MPVAVTYPGVYIQEIPSGVRTITGVATSITAFIGRAVKGPVNEPTLISSFGEFQGTFGGLGQGYPMSYAVQDFYINGGSQAIIVRLFKAPVAPAGGAGGAAPGGGAAAGGGGAAAGGGGAVPGGGAAPGGAGAAAAGAAPDGKTRPKPDIGLSLEAASPGKWAEGITVVVDNKIPADLTFPPGLTAADLFNLTFQYNPPDGPIEVIRNVSVKEGPRRVDRALKQESQYVRVHTKPDGTPDPPLPGTPPTPTDTTKPLPKFSDGMDSDSLDAPTIEGDENQKTGMFALKKADLFNLLCIPPDARDGSTDPAVYPAALKFCVDRRAMLIVDPPAAWSANPNTAVPAAIAGLPALGLSGLNARNAAIYFPRVIEPDLLRNGQLDTFVPCGIIAGVMARTDTQRGVWKAPAGLDATLNGIQGLAVNLNDDDNGLLNPIGINCLRSFGINGRVVWGARTLRGADQLADDYKYVPVRRLALYIEESLYRGTQWVVFEPNDEPLWAQIRLNVGAFMHNLFRQGAFQGKTPQDAYFVKCDKETTTQNDINLGIVNIVVGFAPLKPAEFVIIQIQQMAGQIQT
jgi:phage tail sheath protein FI